MTIEKNYMELIYAYAFGCLDLEEQSDFLDYQNVDPNFNWEELGEYQNLASLLPSILTIENPATDVKQKVAKKLYSFKEEIRAKKKGLTVERTENTDKTKTEDENTIKSKPIIEVPKEEKEKPKEEKIDLTKEEIIKENIKINNEEIEVVAPEKRGKDILRPSQATQISGRNFKSFLDKKKKTVDDEKIITPSKSPGPKETIEKNKIVLPDEGIKLEEEKPVEKEKVVKETVEKKKKSTYVPYSERRKYVETKSKNYSPVIFLLFIIMIAGFLWLYFSTNSKISKLQKEVDRLTYQASSLTTSLKKSKELQEILTTKNVKVINLNPTRIGKSSYGRLIISFDKNKGFYQMFNLPKLEKSMSYQLWVNVSRSYFSLGVFTSGATSEYHPFKLPQLSGKRTIRFLVSKETKLGAERPGKLVYLRGKL